MDPLAEALSAGGWLVFATAGDLNRELCMFLVVRADCTCLGDLEEP